MVRLTIDHVQKKIIQIKNKKTPKNDFKKNEVSKLTHLCMNDSFVTSIGDITACINLKVIYLQNNSITKIENLNFAKNLTHLYLQHNHIEKIEGLDAARNLQKLYLGYNNISVIEGLENLKNLTELYIENQNLSNSSICFDPRSILTLRNCLRVLDISKTKLSSLNEIKDFYSLEVLKAKNNHITDLKDLSSTIKTLFNLRDLMLQGNPVTQVNKYQEIIIASSNKLVNLDNKTISDINRQFMRGFQRSRKFQRLDHTLEKTVTDDITNSLNLPPAFVKSITRAIFQQPELKPFASVISIYDNKNSQAFPAWKSSMSINGMRANRVVPRPFWRTTKSTTYMQSSKNALFHRSRTHMKPVALSLL